MIKRLSSGFTCLSCWIFHQQTLKSNRNVAVHELLCHSSTLSAYMFHNTILIKNKLLTLIFNYVPHRRSTDVDVCTCILQHRRSPKTISHSSHLPLLLLLNQREREQTNHAKAWIKSRSILFYSGRLAFFNS